LQILLLRSNFRIVSMGVINKLREKMGKAVVFAVGFAILSFVAADLLGPQSVLFGQGKQLVGEIKGEKISYPEFIAEIEKLRTIFFINNQKTPGPDDAEQLRQQAWNNFLLEIGFGSEYDKLGILVTDDEMVDMVQGVNIHPAVINAFTDPNTGVFDRSRLVSYLQNLESLEPLYQRQWADFEKSLKPERNLAKLVALMSKTVYSTKRDIEREHIKANAKVNASYLYIPYFAIADSTIEVTKEDLKEVLEDRREEFKLSDNIFFDYVSFPVVPSADDSAYYREEMADILSEFEEIEDDSSYIKLNSDDALLPTFYSPESIPVSIADTLGSMEVGQCLGPFEEAGGIKIYKLIARGSDTAGQFVQASHVLIKTDERSEVEARKIAQPILRQALNGADFASLAQQYSEGPSGPNGGELGWFGRGRMVAEFEAAAFSMEEPGVYPELVKTQFGYHIIMVSQAKSDANYLIGSITRTISPSDETMDEVFRKADFFAGTSKSPEEFETKAAESGLTILKARNIGKNDQFINGISNIRQVIRWGFADAEPGDVSQVFELDDQFLVALLTMRQEEGYAEVSDVEERLKPFALKKLKAKELRARLEQLPEQESLEEAVKAFGDEAKFYTISGTLFNANSLTGIGFDPAAVGTLFGLLQGNQSEILEGENGIMIMRLDLLEPAQLEGDLSPLGIQFKSNYENQASVGVSEAIREDAEIVDLRYKFF
jgi:peptidyl-prolyl cis-trans isomerase D